MPRRDGNFLSGRGVEWGLVEADAGYVGGLDGVGEVVDVLCEGDSEVLDLVRSAEFHQKFDEDAEVFDEEVIGFVGGDVAYE